MLKSLRLTKKATKQPFEDDHDEKLAAILAPLTERYRIFVVHYCRFLSKTAAALAAGYSERTASQGGFNVYNREEVRNAITAYLKATEITPEDNLAGIKRMAEIDMTQYFTWRETFEDVRKRVPLSQVLIDTLVKLREEDTIFLEAAPGSLSPMQKTEMLQTIKALELSAARLKHKIKHNPLATQLVWTTVLKREKVLDIDKIIEDKVPIKSVKYTEHGIQLEMYSAAEARRDLARVAGSFEKDNIQKPAMLLNAPVVNVYDKAPPLSDNEADIEDRPPSEAKPPEDV